MRIRCSLALNENETYCCSKKRLKEAFAERDLEISLGRYQGFRNQRHNSRYFFPRSKGEIIVLAILNVQKRRKSITTGESYSRLSIQRVAKKDFSEKQKILFEREVLPKLVDFFDKHIDYDVTFHQHSNVMLVGVRNGEWIIETRKEGHLI